MASSHTFLIADLFFCGCNITDVRALNQEKRNSSLSSQLSAYHADLVGRGERREISMSVYAYPLE